jgi:hypothetical protein
LGSAVYFPLHKIFGLDFIDSNVIFYNSEDNSSILLIPEKNFYPIESFGDSYYKKFFDGATLIYKSTKDQEIRLTIPFLSHSFRDVELYVNDKFVGFLNFSKSKKVNYIETPSLRIKKGKNTFRFFSRSCSINKAFPCDIHFLAIPKKYNAYFWVTLFTIGLSSSLLMVFFYRSLEFFNLETHFRDFLVFTLAAGTLIIPYTLTMTQHPLTAFLLFLSFYYTLKSKLEKNRKKYVFFSGLFMGLSIISEFYVFPVAVLFFVYHFFIKKNNSQFNLVFLLLTLLLIIPLIVLPDIFGFFSSIVHLNYLIIFAVISLIVLTIYVRKIQSHSLIFLASLLIPLSLYAFFNVLTIGKILPIFFYREFYHYKDSFWLNPTGWNKFDKLEFREPKLIYTFNLFLGHHGIFFVMPSLFFSLYSLLKISFSKVDKFKKEGILIFTSFIVLSTIFIFHTHNYASASYAFRWFIPFIPILFFFLGFFVDKNKSNKPLMILFFIAIIISIYMALIGSRNPWKPIPETDNFIWKLWEKILLKPIGLEYRPPY